jgi:integrase
VNSRPWFNSAEYSKLHNSILAHAKYLETRDKRQFAYAMELYDFVLFGTNTGMRVGEMRNCKVSDVKIVTEKLT